jgi:transketolase
MISPANATASDLASIARDVRATVLRMSCAAGAPHLASALSCVDLLAVAYWQWLRINPAEPADPSRDRLIFSKGHAASALYATLAHRGFFPMDDLQTYGHDGSRFGEQPIPHAVPGVEAATGSLGHGLPIGLGLALAANINQMDYRVLVLMGDGECNEGSVWEAAMLAPAQNLGNLAVMVDFNRWQATGRSEEIMSLASLRDKFAAFGWDARDIDGHDLPAITQALGPRDTAPGDKPRAIIAHTTKGKGVPFMEDDNNWHYRVPNDKELAAALSELI